MRRSIGFIGLILAVSLGFVVTPTAWAGTTSATGAPASVTITGPNPATLAFPFARAGDSAYDLWVHYKTENGTAVAGTDYLAGSGVFKIPAGAATAALPIVALGTATASPDKQFTLDLTGAVGVGPAPDFGPAAPFAAAAGPLSVATADVNGDGKLDLIVANSIGGSVSVLLNATAPGGAAPSFATTDFTVGTDPFSVTTADVNGDGKPDLIVANEGDDTVSVLVNDSTPGGAANFDLQQIFTVGTSPSSVTAVDVNGDGKPDLVTANFNANNVSVLVNGSAPGGALSFTAQTFTAGNQPFSVASADVNGDGKPDLIAANAFSNAVSVLVNTTAPGGTVGFTVQSPLPVGRQPVSVTTADVNGDGKPDLIAANQIDGTVSVLVNDTAPGDPPSFEAQQPFTVGSSPASVTAADVNGDGKPDLIVANEADDTVSVLVNTTTPGGAPSFEAAQPPLTVGNSPASVTTADLNGDGKPDLITANFNASNVSVLMNTTPAPAAVLSFATQQTFTAGSEPISVTTADVNGDGKPDSIVADASSNTVSVLVNTTAPGATSPSFAPQQPFGVGSFPASVATADVNGDGRPDLVVANEVSNNVSVLVNTTAPGGATASFAAQQTFISGPGTYSVATADVNGDGKPDLVVANDVVSGTVSVLMNTTVPGDTPSFATQQTFDVGIAPVSVTAADVNGDGKLDLIVANGANPGSVSVLVNTTAPDGAVPNFAAHADFAVENGSEPVTAADVNGDGKPDLIVANGTNPGSVSVLVNTTAPGGAVSFALTPAFPVGSAPGSVATADVNGDGRPDIITANGLDDDVSVLLNTTVPGGAVSFAAQQTYSAGIFPSSVVTADVNGDGRPDLVAANENSNTVSVFLNTQYAATVTPASVAGTIHYDVLKPAVTLAPTPLTFGDQVVAVASAPESITLTNSGNADLLNIAISVAGADPVDFAQTNDCPASLAPNAHCTIQVTFTPVAAGARAATLEVSSNASTSPDGVVLSGTGVAAHPELDVSPDSLDFGDEPLGTASAVQTVTVTNGGNVNLDVTGVSAVGDNPGDFALASNGCPATLAPGAMCTLSFSFTPTAEGVRSADEIVATDDPCAGATIAVSGNGLAPEVSLAPAALGFGTQTVGGTGNTQTATLANTGNSNLTYTIAFSGAAASDYTQTDNCPNPLTASSSCSIEITFKPPAAGTRAAALAITSDAPSSPDTVALTGAGNLVAPVAYGLTLTTYENNAIGGTLPASGPNGDDLSYQIAEPPANGTVLVTTATGAFTYTPDPDFSDADSFSFTATDTVTGQVSNSAMVTITVIPTPPPGAVAPVASNLTLTTYENEPIGGTLPAAVTPSTDALHFTATQPTHGSVVVTNAATGAFIYTPNNGFSGASDTFSFTAKDTVTGLTSNTATVTIAVNATPPPGEVAPVASNLFLTTYENEVITGTLPAAVTPASHPLTFAADPPQHGTLNLDAATGAFTYTPEADSSASDNFTFTATDTVTGLVSNTATVTIAVNPTPPPAQVAPVASDLTLTTYENELIGGTLPAVVTPSTHALSFVTTQPTHGSVVVTDPVTGAFTYTPDPGFSGASDTFSFHATDTVTGLVSNTAMVTITVNATPPPGEVAPVASDMTLTTYENVAIGGTLPAAITPASHPLTFAADPPQHGTLNLDAATGAFTYTPEADSSASDNFTFHATDTVTGLVSNTATVTLTVNPTPPPNTVPPVASNLDLTGYENVAISATLPAAVTPSNLLSFVATQPAHGVVNVTDAATGAFTYMPDPGFSESDSFTFTAKDTVTGLTSNIATVMLTINPTPPPGEVAPVANNLSLTTYENAAISGRLPAVVTPSADTLAFALAATPVNGGEVRITDTATGAFTYMPASDYSGPDTFSFTATDTVTGLVSDVAAVNITVNPTPPPGTVPPLASNLELTTYEGAAIGGTLPAAVIPSDDPLVFAIEDQPTHGTLTLDATRGAFGYRPADGFTGSDHFTFTATDTATKLSSNVATVSIQIGAVPTPTSSSGGGGWGATGLLLLAALAALAAFFKSLRKKTTTLPLARVSGEAPSCSPPWPRSGEGGAGGGFLRRLKSGASPSIPLLEEGGGFRKQKKVTLLSPLAAQRRSVFLLSPLPLQAGRGSWRGFLAELKVGSIPLNPPSGRRGRFQDGGSGRRGRFQEKGGVGEGFFMRRSTIFAGLIVAVSLGFVVTPTAWAGPSATTGAPGSVTITGPNPATIAFPFARTGDSAYDVWVHYKTEDGTAVAGTDYVGASGAFKIPAGAATAALPIEALGADCACADQLDFTLDLTGAVGVGPTPNFAPWQTSGAGNQPRSVTAADVNGDGKPDLIVANNTNPGTVSVLLNATAPGATTPTLRPPVSFATGAAPSSVVVVDLNGDGRPDIVTANNFAESVSVLRNTTAPGAATASFAAQQTFSSGPGTYWVTAADVNGDGKLDLIVADLGGGVSVLLNTTTPGATTLSFAPAVSFVAGSAPSSVVTADVNGDGKPDLIVANFSSSNVSVLLNTTAPGAATANFAIRANFGVGTNPWSVTAADVNGDGKPDMIVANNGSSNVSVLLNTTAPGASSPSFAPQQTFAVDSNPFSLTVTAADVNGDGKPDLLVANDANSNVSVLENTTAPGATVPSFAPQQTFGTAFGPTSVTATDVNGDGKPDLVVTNITGGDVSVLMNTTPAPTAAAPSFATHSDFAAGNGPASVATADLNGDGKPDLFIANYSDDNGFASVLLNTTAPGAVNPSFATQQTFTVGISAVSVTVADVNGDGKPDLIAALGNPSGTVSVLLNTTVPGGAASFATQQTFSVGVSPSSVTAADVNGDGKPDLIVANEVSENVSVLLNTTAPGALSSSFKAQQTLIVGGVPYAVTAVDVNGDGRPDLAIANAIGDDVSVLLNTTAPGALTASFAAVADFAAVSLPVAVTAKDVNGDGRPDIIAANNGSSNVSVLLNTTAPGALTASFAAQVAFTVGLGPTSVAAADVNGDGKPDLVATSQLGNIVSVLLNTTAPGAATPSFAPRVDFPVGTNPKSVTTTDVNGDGSPDLLVANSSSPGSVSVLLNTQYAATLAPASVTGTIHYAIPELAPLPATLGFGTQQVGGAGVTQTLTLDNTGNADLDFSLAIGGAAASDYTQTNNCPNPPNYSLTAGSDCSVTVTFKPSAAGTRAAALTITSNAPSSPDSVALTGVGNLVPPTAYPLTLTTYENQTIGGTLPASGPNGDDLSYLIAEPPGQGVVVITTTTGAFTYTPASGYNGGDSFTFTATDTVTGQVSSAAMVTITVVPTPPPGAVPPVANNLTLTTFEGDAITGTLPAVVTPSTDTLHFTATQPAHGSVEVTDTTTGAFIYTPDTGFSDGDSFTFQATDTVTNLPSNTATVTITVNATPPPNAVAPVASNLTLTTYENEAIGGTLPAVVTPSADTLVFALAATTAAHGAVAITNVHTGAFTYTPDPGFSGASDNFTFTAKDTVSGLTSNTATVTITVNATPPPNIVAPVASDLTLTTYENEPIGGTLPAVVTPSADTLSFAIPITPMHGTVVVTNTATGAFTYTPDPGFSGASDTFSFNATDTVTGLVSNTATVSITVNATPPPGAVAPVASDMTLTTYENVAISGTLPAAVTPSDDPLTFVADPPQHGTLNLDAATGAFTYTPAADSSASDGFTFHATDTVTGLVSNTATVTIAVNATPPPDAVPPIANDMILTTYENTAFSGSLPAAVTPGTDTLTFLAATPGHGTVNVTDAATGAFTYTPDPGFSGPDTFTFIAKDTVTGLTSNIATVSIAVTTTPPPAPVAPVASDMALTTYENAAITGSLPAVVTPSADTLVFALAATPTHGGEVDITDTATGAFTYTPAGGYSGPDTFSFTATDTVTGKVSNVAKVNIIVNPTPPPGSVPPVASGLEITTYMDVAIAGTLPAVVTPSDDPLTFAVQTQPLQGTLTLDAATGAFHYQPADGYTGRDRFTFTATDTVTKLSSNVATVTIHVFTPPTPTSSSGGGGAWGAAGLLLLAALAALAALLRRRQSG